MTKKDFIKFANMSHNLRGILTEDQRLSVMREIADLFEEDNPRFDRDQFLAACGL